MIEFYFKREKRKLLIKDILYFKMYIRCKVFIKLFKFFNLVKICIYFIAIVLKLILICFIILK